MNQIIANIKSRRSRRSFLNQSIPEEIIKEIIEAGIFAPSALNKQPWKFIVITDRDCINKLSCIVKDITVKIARFLTILKLFRPSIRDPQVTAAIKKTASSDTDTVFHKAPCLVLIVSDGREPYACRACSFASQNMMLYANSIGISSCFIGRANLLMLSKTAKKIIGLPTRHKIQAAIVFGYASQAKDDSISRERRKNNIIKWIR